MRVKTESGEIGIIYDGTQYVYRPSLKNIQNIGTPKEIISIMLDLVGHNFKPQLTVVGRFYMHQETKRMFNNAIKVIEACGTMPSGLFGWYKGSKFNQGAVSIKDTITIAIGLIQAGVVGKPIQRRGDKKEMVDEFNATDMIMTCATKLSISVSDAKEMTLIEMQRAIDIAYPDTETGNLGMTDKEYDGGMNRANELAAKMKIKVA